MSKYEVTLDRRGTSVAPWDAKEVVEADSMRRQDRHISLLTKQSEVVAIFPTDRVVSIVKLDTDPLEAELETAREVLSSQMRLTAKYFHEIEDLRRAAKPHFIIYKRRLFRKAKWVATFDGRAGVRFSSHPDYTFDLNVGEEQA